MYLTKLARKSLLAAGAAVGLSVASTSAMAVVFPDFTVDPSAYSSASSFTADKITGNYTEVVTFGATTFDVSILWNAGQFVQNDGTTALSGGTTGLGDSTGYNMYALFQGTGTFGISGSTASFSLSSGSLDLYVDPSSDTTFTAPVVGSNPWTTGSSGDDVAMATGGVVAGSGTLNTGCSGGINCGSFGQTTTFVLTSPDGTSFFVSPVPFYNLSFQSGQFNNFTVAGTQTINGSMDAVFTVPEPGTVALLGVGLLGMGLTMKRNRTRKSK